MDIITVLLILGIILITVGYMKRAIYDQPEKIEYRYLNDFILNESVSDGFKKMFYESDPWVSRFDRDNPFQRNVQIPLIN